MVYKIAPGGKQNPSSSGPNSVTEVFKCIIIVILSTNAEVHIQKVLLYPFVHKHSQGKESRD